MTLNISALSSSLEGEIKTQMDDHVDKYTSDSNSEKAAKAMADAVAKSAIDHINDNLQIQIPAGTVIVEVTGGSGAPAVGIKNTTPINVNFE
jgi:hypothetical protein